MADGTFTVPLLQFSPVQLCQTIELPALGPMPALPLLQAPF